MLQFALSILAALRVFFRSRRDTSLEILALRQQVAVLKLKPQTFVVGHRAGFRLYWRWRSRPGGGRQKSIAAILALICRLAQETTTIGWQTREGRGPTRLAQ